MATEMESWSFPPDYDDSYFPPAGQRHWFPKRETMPHADREKAILERLKEVCAYAYSHAPFYKTKWDEAGFHPSQLKSLEDFESSVPVVTKAELRASQAASPPFGDYLCIPDSEIHHVHGTSGTTGRPTAFAIGCNDWRSISNAHARIMWGMGMRPGDIICVAAIFSLYVGSWGALAGAERLGAKAFPFGAGAAGMSARCAQWLDLLRPQAFYGTPTYALHLGQTAIDNGLDPRQFGLRQMFFSGEPGASIPAVRGRIEELFGAKVFDSGSMGEMTPWMNVAGSAETEGMLCWQDVVYTEVCDPNGFCRVPYGQRGTPVYTHLERTSQPMIRLLSGDLTMWEFAPNPCGRTYPRLPMGIIGRIDDMFTIRGENVYPSEIDAVLNETPGYGGEHRIVITRDGVMDELVVKVEAEDTLWREGPARIAAFRGTVAAGLQKLLGLRAVVEIVAQNSIERTDFKARRVIDDREVLRDMRARLEGASS
ncbi:phenylacetate--CoA ligase family protein [Allomesorhizobium camelthorni]|uniref:Phenylacetate--CoA ligase n=1 Tax=Allomesorhizobium camelthorni TaxID=475069 RepID=A0A6G4WHQ2_9HYPH|nr:phenylacetate--CoA ligase [Mesorhizobium camelthorni]NGO53723.1 phenylacetate--CoA ligase [Mesorhizobium camelthorni]